MSKEMIESIEAVLEHLNTGAELQLKINKEWKKSLFSENAKDLLECIKSGGIYRIKPKTVECEVIKYSTKESVNLTVDKSLNKFFVSNMATYCFDTQLKAEKVINQIKQIVGDV